MASKDRYNPANALMAIFDRHEGLVDKAAMQQYLSFVSFLSLYNIYQNMMPQTSTTPTNDLMGMLNQFTGAKPGDSAQSGEALNMDSLKSILGNQEGIGSLLSSIPPETISKVTSMLGGASGGPGSKGGSPLMGMLSMAAKNPALISSLLGGGGGGGLASLLGGGRGGGLASLLGGGGGGAAAPLLSLLGGKNLGGGLGGLLGGKGLGGLGGLAALAPLAPMVMPLIGSFGRSMNRKSRSKRVNPIKAQQKNIDQLVSILQKSEDFSAFAPIVPQLAEVAKTGNMNNVLPMMLPLIAKNSKKIRQGIQAGLKPFAKAMQSSKDKTSAKTTAQQVNAAQQPSKQTPQPVQQPAKVKPKVNPAMTVNTMPDQKTGLVPKQSFTFNSKFPMKTNNMISIPSIINYPKFK